MGYLQIKDPKSLSDKALQDLIHELGENPQHAELVASLRSEVWRRGQEAGCDVKQAARALSANVVRAERVKIAEAWAPILGISKEEFLRIIGFKKPKKTS